MKNVLIPLLSMILTILLGLFILSLASSCAQGQPFTPLYPFWVEHEPDGTHDIPGLIGDANGPNLYEALALGIVNVKHYGAIGNGIADDTVAFHTAMTAAMADGVAVYVPPGDYLCTTWTNEFWVTAPLTVYGVGPESHLIGPDIDSNCFDVTADLSLYRLSIDTWHTEIDVNTLAAEVAIRLVDVHNANSRRLGWRMCTNAAEPAIRDLYMSGCIIDHSDVAAGTHTCGLWLAGPIWDARIVGNAFRDIHGTAIALGYEWAYGTNDTKGRYVIADHEFSDLVSPSALETFREAHAALLAGRWATVTGNTIHTVANNTVAASDEAIYLKAAHCVVANNTIFDGCTDGNGAITLKGQGRTVWATATAGFANVVTGNNIAFTPGGTPNAVCGIYSTEADVLIAHNYIEYPPYWGIKLDLGDTENVTVAANTIRSNRGDYAIYSVGSGRGLRIIDNDVNGLPADRSVAGSVYGIGVSASASGMENLDIIGNRITAGDECVAATSVRGILIYHQTGPITDAVVRDNVVRIAHTTLPEYGIVEAGAAAGTGIRIYDNDLAGMAGTNDLSIVSAIAGMASHDYGAAAVAWTMTKAEATANLFVVTNASGAADAVFPVAQRGKQFSVYNNSGAAVTFKVQGQTGAATTNGKYSTWTMNATDCVKIYEQP
jgi:hypothetical protein